MYCSMDIRIRTWWEWLMLISYYISQDPRKLLWLTYSRNKTQLIYKTSDLAFTSEHPDEVCVRYYLALIRAKSKESMKQKGLFDFDGYVSRVYARQPKTDVLFILRNYLRHFCKLCFCTEFMLRRRNFNHWYKTKCLSCLALVSPKTFAFDCYYDGWLLTTAAYQSSVYRKNYHV